MSKPSGAGAARGLVTLSGGRFQMGTRDPDAVAEDHETAREETVAPFRIATEPVTNRQFAAFVKATGHVTTAEQEGWSAVFHALVHPAAPSRPNPVVPWWHAVEGATWRRPWGGPEDAHARLTNHPVVHVSHTDALAYCDWAGLRLPTEVEWEHAARGGLEEKRFPWGDELTPRGRTMCTIFDGDFPHPASRVGTTPVKSHPANGFGLHDVVGNVWEWTSDAWETGVASPSGPEVSPCCASRRPPEPDTATVGAGDVVIRGGSYLCHDSYCNRYRVSARTHNTPDSTTGNQGFRVAADV